MLGSEDRAYADREGVAVRRGQQVAVFLSVVNGEPAIGRVRPQRRERDGQVAEPVIRQVRGGPKVPFARGGQLGDQGENLGADWY